MFIIVVLLYLFRGGSQAAPLSLILRETSTSDPSSSFPACTCPDQRSIWDIIWSCFATIFACSWVSVHPNIPVTGEKFWRITLRRAEYMVWTILAPELVIYWAMRQYFGAREIANRYQARGWTTTHGHFLQMGGFMVFEGGFPKGVLSYSPRDLAGSFNYLLERNHIKFPTITKEEIEDRRKSDGLAKCLVIGQTGWFVLQCIARQVAGFVITELELVTLALATLSTFMYFFWWHKPFDVQTQVRVDLIDLVSIVQPEDDAIKEDSEETYPRTLLSCITDMLTAAFFYWPKAAIKGTFRWMGDISFSNAASLILHNLIIIIFDWPKLVIVGVFYRLVELAEWGQCYQVKQGDMKVPMFYSSPALGPQDDSKILGLASFMGITFGAIHCAGWNFTFPTDTELIIWRICSIIITTIPTTLSLYAMAGWSPAVSAGMFRKIGNIPAIASPIYFLARLLLLVDTLLTLRNLPKGAYAVLEWTTRLPHI